MPTGGTASFSVSTSIAPDSFVWRHDGVPMTDDSRIAGSNTATITITGTLATDEGLYDCVAANACYAITSNPVALSCNPILFSQPPTHLYQTPGTQLSITVPSNAPYTYQWRQNGAAISDIPGVLTGTTTTTSPSSTGPFDRPCTSSCGSTTSSHWQSLTSVPPTSTATVTSALTPISKRFSPAWQAIAAKPARPMLTSMVTVT